MEADVLNALKSKLAFLPGGKDCDANLIIIFQLPFELKPWTRRHLEVSTKYLLSSVTSSNGFVAVVDAQKCPWKFAREEIKFLTKHFEDKLSKIYIVRTDAFSMQNCTKTYKRGEPIIVSKSRLNKFFDSSVLPVEIGGQLNYNHDDWIQNRVQIDNCSKKYDLTVESIKNITNNIANTHTMRAIEIEQTVKIYTPLYNDVQQNIKSLIECGNQLISHIKDRQIYNDVGTMLSQDIIDGKEKIEFMLNQIEKEQTDLSIAWNNLETSLHDAKEITAMEEGVSYVTNWILSTAETMLIRQLKVGHDVQSAEKYRLDHEILELQCWKTYGFYGELKYKIDMYKGDKESFAYKDLLSQKDFMDFVCRSFATRLERRRNVLISSVRFFRLVTEYFQRTSNVFESLLKTDKDNLDNLEFARSKLQKIKESQQNLENVEKELVKEGEKLSDILSMPIKDALGREIEVDYSEDIANLRDVLDAAKDRFKIFSNSLEMQKLTFEKIMHIHGCEADAKTALKWVQNLFSVLLGSHTHVGRNIKEIQNQKEEHQLFQDTAKSTFNYGYQLLNAAFMLRQSCKLNSDANLEIIELLKTTWKNFDVVSQEQMTRLRVSAIFFKSVDEQLTKLEKLKENVEKLKNIEDDEQRLSKMKKYLTTREQLLVEVGRMVRLGRLLKSRLKEPFLMNSNIEDMSNEENIIATPIDENSIAIQEISTRLVDISNVAESLDTVIHESQQETNILSTVSSIHFASSSLEASSRKMMPGNSSDDWNSSLKSSTEDESFVTASECAPSRSSSYHTASECRGNSPWTWNDSTERSSVEFDSSDPEQSTLKALSDPSSFSSSSNNSFDDDELPPDNFESSNVNLNLLDIDTSSNINENMPPALPPKYSSLVASTSFDNNNSIVEVENTENISENKIYTIYESPANSPNDFEEHENVLKVSDDNNNISELTGLSYYYQNIITKQVLKTML